MIYFENFIIEEGTKILIAEGTEVIKAEVIKAEVIKKGVEIIEAITEIKNKILIDKSDILVILNPYKQRNIVIKTLNILDEVKNIVLNQDIKIQENENEVYIVIKCSNDNNIIIEVNKNNILCAITKNNIEYYEVIEVNTLNQITEYISKYY